MNLLPIIAHELRVQGRRPFTYWLRVTGVAALLLLAGYFKTQNNLDLDRGAEAFGLFNATLFFGIWVVTPFLAADCISRERREGTLGLLFLTKLSARNIVVAKSITLGLRMMSIWLAMCPVLMIPLLIGGVAWNVVVLSLCINFSSLCLALAAGIVASACCRSWRSAIILAALIASGLFVAMALIKGFTIIRILMVYAPRIYTPRPFTINMRMITDCILVAASANNTWHMISRMMNTAGVHSWLLAEVIQSIGALLVLALAVEIAGRIVRRKWRDAPESVMQQRLQITFCRPVVWAGVFKRWMRHKLELNPVGWLEQRTVWGRLALFGWLAVVIGVLGAALSSNNPSWDGKEFSDMEKLTSWLLLGNIAACAAASFRRERENGVMELLLVAPLEEYQIIHGRLRGLWGQFLPALALLAATWIYFSSIFNWSQDHSGTSLFYVVVSFMTLPVTGLYFSLRCRNGMAAASLTFLFGIILPVIVGWLIDYLLPGYSATPPELNGQPVISALLQIMLALVLHRALRFDLNARNFSLRRVAA